ncbi:MAG: hypothetical protein PUP92_04985 [Rhizonema sp. PD38]|nr:hypothetical protein [Rhizonema sp. PD38]
MFFLTYKSVLGNGQILLAGSSPATVLVLAVAAGLPLRVHIHLGIHL